MANCAQFVCSSKKKKYVKRGCINVKAEYLSTPLYLETLQAWKSERHKLLSIIHTCAE